jgi:DNA/RNA-binding domain of Phe-tRNA-synthetase-like protein
MLSAAMRLLVTPEIFEMFPDAILGVVIARGIDNAGDPTAVFAELRRQEERVHEALYGVSIPDHPRIACWREAYRQFGAKPKDYPSSIENLMRRVIKGHALPHINTLVDLYNTVSLRHLLPAGGEDLDRIEGDVLLTRAGEDEAPVRLLGEPEERAPRPGEVIYKDDAGAICRRWNWKEADRTKLTPETRNAVLVIERLPPVTRDQLSDAVDDLAGLVRTHCGGEVRTVLVDRDDPETDLT